MFHADAVPLESRRALYTFWLERRSASRKIPTNMFVDPICAVTDDPAVAETHLAQALADPSCELNYYSKRSHCLFSIATGPAAAVMWHLAGRQLLRSGDYDGPRVPAYAFDVPFKVVRAKCGLNAVWGSAQTQAPDGTHPWVVWLHDPDEEGPLDVPCNIPRLLARLDLTPQQRAMDVTRSILWPLILERFGADVDMDGSGLPATHAGALSPRSGRGSAASQQAQSAEDTDSASTSATDTTSSTDCTSDDSGEYTSGDISFGDAEDDGHGEGLPLQEAAAQATAGLTADADAEAVEQLHTLLAQLFLSAADVAPAPDTAPAEASGAVAPAEAAPPAKPASAPASATSTSVPKSAPLGGVPQAPPMRRRYTASQVMAAARREFEPEQLGRMCLWELRFPRWLIADVVHHFGGHWRPVQMEEFMEGVVARDYPRLDDHLPDIRADALGVHGHLPAPELDRVMAEFHRTTWPDIPLPAVGAGHSRGRKVAIFRNPEFLPFDVPTLTLLLGTVQQWKADAYTHFYGVAPPEGWFPLI